MDFDKLMEKALKWLSDPKGREVVKSLVYVLLPLIVISLLRNLKRGQVARKQATAINPGMRGPSTESLAPTETLQESMAKEKKKVEREMQELFGRRERGLTKARGRGLASSQMPAEARMSESPGPGDAQAVREDLIRVFLGRRRE